MKARHNILNLFKEDAALKENEVDANRQMILSCASSSMLTIVMLLGYIFHWFLLTDYTSVYIFLPINAVALLVPLFFRNSKYIYYPWFKYVLMGLLLWVVVVINIILPKHTMIAWAIPIILTNHYFSKRFGLVTYIFTILLMLICIYLGMFFGEYDPHLLTEGIIVDGQIVNPQTATERYYMLKDLLARGENRYAKVFFYYYLTRLAILSIIFFISRSLNGRTFALLKREKEIDSEKQKLENDLQIASQIQEAALPKPTFRNKEVAIQAALFPAKQIAGDFYDYYLLDRNHIAILVGDVSGKGAPAALFMMRAITCFKDAVKLDKSVLEIMKEVNAALCEGNDKQMFVTAFFGVLDTRNGELHYVNAGHCAPLFQRQGRFIYLPCSPGFVLGAMSEIPLKEEVITLEPGSMFYIYTDGVTEAKNAKNELFGKKRLLEVMNRFPYKSTLELFREFQDEIWCFEDGAEQADDLTAMAIHYLYDEIHIDECSLIATTENANVAMKFFLDNMKKDGINPALTNSIAVVIDEIYSNIAKYAYEKQGGDVFLRYTYYKDDQELRFTFIDHGIAYDPTKSEQKTADEREEEGGLGILIVSTIMDDVDYDRRNGKNFLVLTKKLNS